VSVHPPPHPPPPREATHAVVAFARARLRRGVRYGLAFTLALLVTVAALAGFFTLVNALFAERALDPFDTAAQTLVAGHRTPGRTNAALALAWLGGNDMTTVFILVVSAGLLLYRRGWLVFRLVAASGLGGIVVVTLKWIWGRARPFEPIVPSDGYSFPSGHAFAATVFYGMMVYIVWASTKHVGWRALAVVLGGIMALLIGLCRVYLNVHYATDVVGGWLAGLVWLITTMLAIDGVEGWARSRRQPRPVPATEPGAPHARPPGVHEG